METKNTFTPQIIGVDNKLFIEAKRHWERLIEVSTDTLCDMVSFLDSEDISTPDFIKLVDLDIKDCIVKLYELSGAAIPGMSTTKLIELKLISNDYENELKINLTKFKQAKSEAMNLFKYDLSLLRDKDGLFSLSNEFIESLQQSCTIFTTSEAQNEALNQLKIFTSALNYFVDKGILKMTTGTDGLTPLLQVINIKHDRTGFEPGLNTFKLNRWNLIFK